MPSSKKPVNQAEVEAPIEGLLDDVPGDVFGGLTNIELPVDIGDLMEKASEPPLKPGNYMAYIMDISQKENSETGSVGLNVTYGVSKSSDSMEGPFIKLTKYLWLGTRKEDGRVYSISKAGKPVQNLNLPNFIKCFFTEAPGAVDANQLRNRILKIKIVWEPAREGSEDDRTYLGVAGFTPVTVDGIRGPVFEAAQL